METTALLTNAHCILLTTKGEQMWWHQSIQTSCISAGYFPNQDALCHSVVGHITATINTPNLLSSKKKEQLKTNKKVKLFLYPWHFFTNHQIKGDNCKWKLNFNKKSARSTTTRSKIYTTSLLHKICLALSSTKSTSHPIYIHPHDRWSLQHTESRMPIWMLNMIAIDLGHSYWHTIPELHRQLGMCKANSIFLNNQVLNQQQQHTQQLIVVWHKHRGIQMKHDAEVAEQKYRLTALLKDKIELEQVLAETRAQL